MPKDLGTSAHPLASPQNWRVVRPLRQLFRQGIIAVVALTTPVFAVLYWMSIDGGQWPIVLAVHLAVILLTTLLVLGFLDTSIRVSPDAIQERFFGRVRTSPVAEIGSILVLEIYRDSALDTQPHLFIRDRGGRLLLRMRGMFWSRADMDTVINQLDVPIDISDGTFTTADLRRTRPELLYWFERIPRISALWMRAGV